METHDLFLMTIDSFISINHIKFHIKYTICNTLALVSVRASTCVTEHRVFGCKMFAVHVCYRMHGLHIRWWCFLNWVGADGDWNIENGIYVKNWHWPYYLRVKRNQINFDIGSSVEKHIYWKKDLWMCLYSHGIWSNQLTRIEYFTLMMLLVEKSDGGIEGTSKLTR